MKKTVSFTIGIIIASAVLWLVFSRPNSLPLPKKSNSSFRVGSVNLLYKNKSAAEVSRALIKTDFDILVILEWQGNNLELEILENAGYKVFLNYPRSGTHGVSILGRQSWEMQTELIPAPVKGPCRLPIATARLMINNHPVTLLGVHAPPPISACKETTIPTLLKICSWIKDGRLKHNVGSGRTGDAVIIAGDLNMFPLHPRMDSFKRAGLKDIFDNETWRLTPTWSPERLLPAIVQIDYIFAANIFGIAAAYNFTVPGSDHRGVIADLKIQQ